MQVHGKTGKALPAAVADAAQVQSRFGSRGENYVFELGTPLDNLADEGSYYKAVNPTPGTGIAQAVQVSFLATNGLLTIRNGDTVNGKRIYLDYLRLINTVVPATATRSEALIAIDTGTVRYSSGGSQITALHNANMDSPRTSIAVVHFGALTLAAETANVRRLSRLQLRAAIPVQFEEYLILFGRAADGGGFNTLGGATAQRQVVDAGPVVLGPNSNHSAIVHLWHPGNAVTAASWEFELAWYER
jgi:hypothetical protein